MAHILYHVRQALFKTVRKPQHHNCPCPYLLDLSQHPQITWRLEQMLKQSFQNYSRHCINMPVQYIPVFSYFITATSPHTSPSPRNWAAFFFGGQTSAKLVAHTGIRLVSKATPGSETKRLLLSYSDPLGPRGILGLPSVEEHHSSPSRPSWSDFLWPGHLFTCRCGYNQWA